MKTALTAVILALTLTAMGCDPAIATYQPIKPAAVMCELPPYASTSCRLPDGSDATDANGLILGVCHGEPYHGETTFLGDCNLVTTDGPFERCVTECPEGTQPAGEI